MWELIKCVHEVVKYEDLFNQSGVIYQYQTMNKYLQDPEKVLVPEDEKIVIKGSQVLQKVRQKLASFKLQHNIFILDAILGIGITIIQIPCSD